MWKVEDSCEGDEEQDKDDYGPRSQIPLITHPDWAKKASVKRDSRSHRNEKGTISRWVVSELCFAYAED